jgi:beta-galactosidase/beta-glucuronidase
LDDSAWKTIPVPASWEMRGYATPIYVNSGYPFKIDPPRVTSNRLVVEIPTLLTLIIAHVPPLLTILSQ